MAWTADDLDRLRTALVEVASGAASVTYADGRQVTFHTPERIVAAIRVVEAQLQMEDRSQGGLVRRRTPAYRSGI